VNTSRTVALALIAAALRLGVHPLAPLQETEISASELDRYKMACPRHGATKGGTTNQID
jgi:hypothetical protein